MKCSEDSAAWRRFVDLYLPLIHGFIRRRGLQDADACNVAQEVLLQVSRSIRSFQYDPDRGRFRSWLGLITHQRIIRHSRGETAAVCGLGNGLGDAISDRLPRVVEAEWLDAFNAHLYRTAREVARAEFDDDTWQAWEYVWEQGISPQEAATRLNRDSQWVYQSKFRVLRRVKQVVVELSEEE